ncbi:MAG: sensor histidine kinase [Hamadaea sp.]|nr:sensor histidine kinase [Hamadaea sp.]
MRMLTRFSDRPMIVDAIFAAVATLGVLIGTVPAAQEQPDMRPPDAVSWTLLVLAGASLVLRRRQPALTVAVTFLVTMAYVLREYAYGPVFLYVMIAMYSLAAWRPLRPAVIAAAALGAGHVAWSVWFEGDPDGWPLIVFSGSVWLIMPLAFGVAVRARRDADRRTHAEEQQRRLSEERLRIAQEVHDAVGHSLAVISMNSGAALHVLAKSPGAPPQVEQSLRAIRAASGTALEELRVALGITSSRAGDSGERAGVARLPDLIATTAVGGLRVELTTSGQARPLDATADLTAYRIVQESLANVVRHARARTATVTLAYLPRQLEVRILDDGVGGSPGAGGTGLASMRARAHTLAGSVTAGPRPAGGFEVHAVLPYGVAEEVA